MATQLNTSNYSKINTDITELMRTGNFSGVNITIYTDSAATTIALDGAAPIENKQVAKINTIGAYTIASSGQFVNACIVVTFTDGSSLSSKDSEDEYWYKLEGITYVRRTF
mgnify:CR=1 FL=1|tara:strand:- start:318 stop:650 length:333 start_codon:yes stop_codon:yes gene_type:complete